MESIIQKTLKLLLDKFGAEYDLVSVTEENGHYYANIEADDAPRLIGKHGKTINALELFVKQILFTKSDEKVFLTVDVDGYKKKRQEALFEKVAKKIEWMQENALGELKLWPMGSAQRRAVHLWIANTYPELTTDSIGEGRERAIKIMYK
ncbi:hypothetical protein CSB37_00780 [bacterium DOLZORAL124_38_8]|nr:MAG: hypothetical protein CSB37_00780 [bacterium DOLZORAL124_38_8]